MPASPADLFDRFHLPIYRYLLRMTGRGEVAEDLTQDVFLRVVRGADEYDARDREASWLFRIARNLLIDWQRRRSREPASREGGEPAIEPGHDLAIGIRQALAQLPVEEREAFLLRAVGGFSHEEIAALVDSTPAGARSRIFRARLKLRTVLSPQPGPDI